MLPLHHRNQVLSDVIQLVTSKQVGNFTARQDVVHVFCRGEESSSGQKDESNQSL